MDTKIKRGQVTIFIVISVIIVALIALFFLLGGIEVTNIFSEDISNPNVYLEGCIEERVLDAIEIVSSQGGYLENDLNIEFLFNSERNYQNISFLCYTEEKYTACVNQEPLLIDHVQEEIKTEIKEDVEECYSKMIEGLEAQKEQVDSKYNDFDIILSSGKIEVIIDGELSILDKGSSSNQESFVITYPTKLYDLLVLTQRILEEEIRTCYFDHPRYMLLYPEINISKRDLHTGESIYYLKDKKTQNRFIFAIKNCVMPGGF
jgi:hypothetical protein